MLMFDPSTICTAPRVVAVVSRAVSTATLQPPVLVVQAFESRASRLACCDPESNEGSSSTDEKASMLRASARSAEMRSMRSAGCGASVSVRGCSKAPVRSASRGEGSDQGASLTTAIAAPRSLRFMVSRSSTASTLTPGAPEGTMPCSAATASEAESAA